jgi:hypothetical protein
MRDTFIILAVALVIILAAILWAFFPYGPTPYL